MSAVLSDHPGSLVGVWSLRRRLRDDPAGLTGHAVGTLTVHESPPGNTTARYTWQEQGEVAWSTGLSSTFTRGYALALLADGWWMQFSDGRPFHPWTPGAHVQHPCRADLYRGYVDLSPTAAAMRVLWEIDGPGKHQRIMTRFRRL